MPQWFSQADLEAIRDGIPAFSSVAGAAQRLVTARGAGDLERLSASGVTADFFSVFGETAVIGRALGPADFGADSRYAVISYRFWRRQFNADPEVTGRRIWLDREPWTVVGVMPAGFSPNWVGAGGADVWVPLTSGQNRDRPSLSIFARLAPNVTIEQARSAVDAMIRTRQRGRLSAQLPGGRVLHYQGAALERLGATEIDSTGPGLLLLQCVAAF